MTTLAMTLGVGGAANFSLRLGEGDGKKSAKIAGNSIMLMIALGLALSALSILFLKPLMVIFGARDAVLSYSMEYGRIIAVGCPFYVLSVGGSQLIRADGSPRYSMFSALLGAILNIILDPIFIFGLNMGMTGAAIATIIGQFASCAVVLLYLRKFKSVRLQKDCFKPQKETMLSIFSLGFSSGLHQIAVTLFQVVMNNTLIHYGELSEYGRDIPLACVGIVSKVNVVFSTIVMGISQGCQPIIGFNFGAGNYGRVKKTYKTAFITVALISSIAFLCYQIFPRQIISIFGDGDELYFEFATRYIRIFLSLVIIVGIQILSSNLFPAIGQSRIGIVTSLSRQIFFLLPLIVVMPLLFGIDGVLYAGPIADGASGILAVALVIREMKKWPKV